MRDFFTSSISRDHLFALNILSERTGVVTANLGTGRGYSVLEMVKAFSPVSGKAVPYRIVARRPGDIGQCYGDPAFAREILGWEAQWR